MSPEMMDAEDRKELAQSPAWNAQERARIEAKARMQQAWILRTADAIANKNRQIEHKAVDGLGEKYGEIPYAAYMQMRALYGDTCWDDPGFIEAFFRDNPQLRVKVTRGTRGQEYAGRARR